MQIHMQNIFIILAVCVLLPDTLILYHQKLHIHLKHLPSTVVRKLQQPGKYFPDFQMVKCLR